MLKKASTHARRSKTSETLTTVRSASYHPVFRVFRFLEIRRREEIPVDLRVTESLNLGLLGCASISGLGMRNPREKLKVLGKC